MRRDKMWWHTGRYVVLFLSTVLCSSSVWGMQTLNRAQDCPSILEGIPDQYLITGKLFLYTIPEKALKYGNNGSIRISSASEDQQLPSWISFEETTRKLIAIPTTHDGFGLYIKVTLSDRLNKCEDVSDIFYLEVKPFYMRYEHSDNDKPEKTCYKGINLIQTTLIFAVNLYKLDAMARYSIMKNLADFLDINAMLIAISTSKELFSIQDKSKSYSILASGRGNTDAVLPNVTELTWRVPCSVFKEVSLFMQVLQHNVVGGRLTREVGYDVVGWYISALVNPSKQYRSRKKRLAPRLSTPTPTPQIQVIPATKALKSSSSLYSASLKTQLLKSSKKLEPKVYETKTDDDHMTDRITSTEESRSTFVSSRVSAVEFEPTKSFTAPTPSASLYDTLKSASFQSSGDQLRPTPTSTYSEYVPKETGRPDRHTTTLQWRESSKYHTGVYEISGSGDVSRFSEFTTDEPITSTTGFGEDFTKPPLTPFIAATPTLTTAVDAVADGDEDIIKTDLEYNGSGSGSGSGDEDIDEEDVTSQIALKPSESSLLGESTPIVKTLYVDPTDTNTFYFEESEIAIRNIPQTTTYEETATPSLSVVHSASWPSRQFPIDRLTLVDVPYVSTSSSHASLTYTPSQSSSIPVRPSRIISGHSYIDSQIGVHSSATLQPPGSSRSGHSYVDSRVGAHSSATLQPSGSSRSGHSYVDSRVGAHSSATLQPSGSSRSGHSYVDSRVGAHSSIHVEQSERRSGHSYIDIKPSHSSGQSYIDIKPSHSSGQSYIDIKPSHSSGQSYIDIKPSHSSGQSYIDIKPSHRSGHSYIDIKPSHSSGQSYIVHKPSQRANETTSIGVKPSHISNHSSIYRKSFPKIDGSSSTVFKPSQSVAQSSANLIVPGSSDIHSYISQSHHRIDQSSRIPSSNFRFKSSHSKPHPSSIGYKPSESGQYTSRPLKPSHIIYEHSSIKLKPSHTADHMLKHLKTSYDNIHDSSIIQPSIKPSPRSIGQSYHRTDQPVSIKPSHSRTYHSSLLVKPSHGRVDPSSEMKPSHRSVDLLSTGIRQSHKRVDRSSEHIKPSSSHKRVDRSSEHIKPSSSHKRVDRSSEHIKPSSSHIRVDRLSEHIKPSSSHKRVDRSSEHIKPSSSHIRVDRLSEHIKPSSSHRRVDHSSEHIKPSSSHKRVDRSSEHIKPSSSHKRVDRSSEHIKPSSSHKRVDRSSEHIKPSSSHIRVDRLSEHIKPSSSHKRVDRSSEHIKPSSSHIRVDRLSEHIKPSSSHRRVDRSSEHIKPSSSHRRVDRSSEHIKPSSSNRRVDRPSVEIIPSQISDSFHPKPSHIHIIDLWPSSSHRSDYSTIMPSSSDIRELPSRKVGPFSRSREIYLSESRLPIASRDLSSGLYLASVLLRLSSQRQDMISSSSHILLLSHSKERYRPSSSSMTHHLSKTKDKDSDFESTRLYSTPVVFPTNPDEWTTPGLRRSKDYKDTFIIPELSKYSSTRCTSGHGCKTDQLPESATRRSTWFPNEHSKTVDEYFTTESTDSNKKVTDEGRFVTEQIPKWYSVEFTPELTTVRSRKTQKKQRKESKPPNLAPDIINPIGKIYAFAGKTFEFQIPENTFNDLEDGSTRDLTLDIAFKWDSYKPPTYSQSWVQFDEAKQTFSGLPLPRDVKESPVEITINAIDQGGKIAQDIILIHINSTDGNIIPTQEFIMRFDVNGRRFLNDRRKLKNLIKKLSAYFADKDSSYITVMDARPGSLIVTWTNNSIATDHCDNMTIHEMRQKVVDQRGYINPKFSKYMSPKYKVTSVEFQLKGACQDVSEPSGAGGMVQVDPWAEAIIPTVIAVAIAIFIVVIILLICSRKQNKEKNKQKEPRHSFEDQDPVMFHREQAQKDKVIRSKRAVILPGDGKPKSSGRRKFFPQIGSPYQPSTFEDQECPSDEEIYGNENATYNSNSHSQPPPPYRLPPPYHVDNGSSYV